MRTRLWITLILFPMVSAVMFGVGGIALLSIASLARQADTGIWIVAAVSLIVSAPISWLMAPRLRLRYWRRQSGDLYRNRAING